MRKTDLQAANRLIGFWLGCGCRGGPSWGGRRRDELDREPVIVDLIDRPHDLLGMPRHADLAAGVAGIEQPEEPGAASVVEALVGLGEQPTGPIQRIILAPTMP